MVDETGLFSLENPQLPEKIDGFFHFGGYTLSVAITQELIAITDGVPYKIVIYTYEDPENIELIAELNSKTYIYDILIDGDSIYTLESSG